MAMNRTKAGILIVDDDPHILFSLRSLLERHFTQIYTEKSPDRIPSLLKEKIIDVIVLDMNYAYGETSGKEGLEWIRRIQDEEPDLSIVPITAYGGVNMAVEALKAGAVDFVLKPWQNEKIVSTLNAAIKYTRSSRKIAILKEQKAILNRNPGFSGDSFIGSSEAMKKVFEKIERVADTEANVLILGENGTGKELVARSIHEQSERRNENFVHVDLGSIAESLFESELFGHVKGAFTDAAKDTIGRFEAAGEGTLFLDEIGNIPLGMQQKLLNALQTREIHRVGSSRATPVDIRLVSATNQNIYKLTNEGLFRNDLFYRINTIEIILPPLRSRLEDLELIGNHYIRVYAKKYKKEINPLSEKVTHYLCKYEWPGNVRELQHATERAVILCSSRDLKIKDFNFRASVDETLQLSFEEYNLDQLEKWAIETCLNKHNGHITHAAAELGLTRGALYRRFEKYDIKKY
jgi:two-component system response regulator HydG